MSSKLAYTIPNMLNKYVKRGKDKLDILSNQGVVYKIFYDCHLCESKEEKRLDCRNINVNKSTSSPTIIMNHHIECNHNFDWSNIKILDKELSYKKRLVSEMVHIKKQSLGLNKQSGSDSLHDSYLSIIQLFFLF